MVFEVPPKLLGTLDDMWFRWVTDVGFPGPDRGEGGRYLILPPGYDGPVPEGGYFVARSRTTRVLILGRAFLENNDPKPAAALLRSARIYPYTPGGYGTSIAEILNGKVRLEPPTPRPEQKFVEGTGQPVMTIPANDFHYFEQINALVQEESVDALDPEIMGSLAAIGIVKGKPFTPDARMKQILAEAAAVGTATGRVLNWRARESDGFSFYPGSAWTNYLFVGGYDFETPPPLVTQDGVKPFPPSGYRTLNSRTAMFFYATGITPAMSMRLTNIGSQYLGHLWIPRASISTAAKPTRSRYHRTFRPARSGRSLSMTTRRAPCCKRPNAIPAPVARAIRGRPRWRVPMGPRSCISGQPSLPVWGTAIGFRPTLRRAGTHCFASTAHLNPSSPNSGGRAKSNWFNEARKGHGYANGGHQTQSSAI